MPRKNFCDVTVLLDRSGSMRTIREATVTGFNRFLREQQEVPGDACWTLVQFDDQYETVYTAVPEQQVRPLTQDTFVPRGMTALLGAMGRAIEETGKRLRSLPEDERPDKVLFVVITDGEENSSPAYEWSRCHTRQRVFDSVRHQQEKYSWTFVFLAANQDAIATATAYGIPASNASTYTHTGIGTQVAYNSLSSGTRKWKLGGNNSTQGFFTDSVPEPPAVAAVTAAGDEDPKAQDGNINVNP